MKFKIGLCPACGKTKELMFSNNPIVQPVCFDCINAGLDYNNIEHAEFFCRSYNLPMNPQMWITLAKKCKKDTFKEYAKTFFEDTSYPNLMYNETTKDVWALINKEWEKCRTQAQVINRLEDIKESYIERSRLKWGQQFTFEELITLDANYTQVVKSCNITNAVQKESLKLLCILQIQMREATMRNDSKTLKDLTSSFASISKSVQLEDMIEQTKTDDLTTVSDLYQYYEDRGFQFTYYREKENDYVDFCMKDVKETIRQTIVESTGIGQLLEQMIKRNEAQQEKELSDEATGKVTVNDLLDIDDMLNEEPEEEDDSELEGYDYSDSEEPK